MFVRLVLEQGSRVAHIYVVTIQLLLGKILTLSPFGPGFPLCPLGPGTPVGPTYHKTKKYYK